MTEPAWFVLPLLAVLLFWAIGAYHRLASLRQAIAEAWAKIDAPLKRRHELLPPMVTALRPLLANEQGALDAVLAADAQVAVAAAAVRPRPSDARAVAALGLAEQMLAAALTRLRALLPQHPQALDDPGVAVALRELAGLDDAMVFARQLFNLAVQGYNAAVHQFPTRLLLPLFRFGTAGSL